MTRRVEPTGPGRPPKHPYDIIDYRVIETPAGAHREPVRVIDRVEEALRANGFVHDAAGRAGLATETLRQWRLKGVRANADLLNGKRRLKNLTQHERECVELAEVMQRAEADARMSLLAAGTKIALGNLEVTKIVERVDPQGNLLERRTEKVRTLPDVRAISWISAHRYPGDFAGRVEVTGAGGGPLEVTGVSPKDQLLASLARAAVTLSEEPVVSPNGQGANSEAG